MPSTTIDLERLPELKIMAIDEKKTLKVLVNEILGQYLDKKKKR